MPTEFMVILKEYGPIVLFMIFYIWRDYRRELLMSKRINALESFHKVELMKLVKEVLVALFNNTEALKDFAKAAATRPCLLQNQGPIHLKGE